MGISPRAVVLVDISPQAGELLKQLVATGCFGFDVADCAREMIYAALRERLREGWPILVEKNLTAVVVSPPRERDFVGELVAERTKKNPRFPAMVAARKRKQRAR